MKIKKFKSDFYIGLFFLLLSIFIYLHSFNITITIHDAMGPRFFPQLVSICMALLSILLIVKSFSTHNHSSSYSKLNNIPKIIATVFILGCYSLLLNKIGFLILTPLYIFFQIILLLSKNEMKKLKNIIICLVISITIPIFLYFLFSRVFSIFLPLGILS